MFVGQILLALLILFIVYRLIKSFSLKKTTKIEFIGWLCFWLIALLVVLWPDITNQIALILGIGRGADVIIYFALILIFYFIFYLIGKIRIIERNIAKLSRQLTLSQKETIPPDQRPKDDTNKGDSDHFSNLG